MRVAAKNIDLGACSDKDERLNSLISLNCEETWWRRNWNIVDKKKRRSFWEIDEWDWIEASLIP